MNAWSCTSALPYVLLSGSRQVGFSLRSNVQTGQELGSTCCLLVSWFAYSSTLKMGATCCSETSVDFHRTAQRYMPEDILGTKARVHFVRPWHWALGETGPYNSLPPHWFSFAKPSSWLCVLGGGCLWRHVRTVERRHFRWLWLK
jgi:hypothetical protein